VNRFLCGAALGVGVAACNQKAPKAPEYEKIPVERRDIAVTASASGAIQPVLTVDVKSKASGEIIAMRVQSGDEVRAGQLLAEVDPRIPRNNLEQAIANLNVARAQLENATTQLARSDTLYTAQAITQTEYESAKLSFATATAGVVRARSDLQTALDAMDDTKLRAPLNGVIIEKNVELGTVISSPAKDVGGGTLVFTMANLDTVQLQALVDETDIGKVQPGLPVTITVDAYPRRPFEGTVLKIEPKAREQQNVTMFPVLVNIANPKHLLKPGMNAEVEIHIGHREDVLAVPNAALRTERDISSVAQVLGLDRKELERQLARADKQRDGGGSAAMGGGGTRDDPADSKKSKKKKKKSSQAADVPQVQPASAPGAVSGGGDGDGMQLSSEGESNHIVFVLRKGEPTPVRVGTGLTDLDYSEVTGGLTEEDTVLVLPSASLIKAQRRSQRRAERATGGGSLPGVRQQP